MGRDAVMFVAVLVSTTGGATTFSSLDAAASSFSLRNLGRKGRIAVSSDFGGLYFVGAGSSSVGAFQSFSEE